MTSSAGLLRTRTAPRGANPLFRRHASMSPTRALSSLRRGTPATLECDRGLRGRGALRGSLRGGTGKRSELGRTCVGRFVNGERLLLERDGLTMAEASVLNNRHCLSKKRRQCNPWNWKGPQVVPQPQATCTSLPPPSRQRNGSFYRTRLPHLRGATLAGTSSTGTHSRHWAPCSRLRRDRKSVV